MYLLCFRRRLIAHAATSFSKITSPCRFSDFFWEHFWRIKLDTLLDKRELNSWLCVLRKPWFRRNTCKQTVSAGFDWCSDFSNTNRTRETFVSWETRFNSHKEEHWLIFCPNLVSTIAVPGRLQGHSERVFVESVRIGSLGNVTNGQLSKKSRLSASSLGNRSGTGKDVCEGNWKDS